MKIIALVIVFSLILFSSLCSANDKKKEVWETTPGGPFTLIITDDEIACEHPKRKRESIRWAEVSEIILVTTDDGPYYPDVWYIFLGENGEGCSVPTEAKGFDAIWNEFKTRFKDIDYRAIIEAGTNNSKRTIWKK